MEVEYLQKEQNVWVYAGREAPFRADHKAPAAVAQGPGAQPEGTRHTTQSTRRRRQVLGRFPGAQDPVEALCECCVQAEANAS